MAQITDELMGHGDDNDGIEEYDNPLPDWWIGLFLLTIVWGIGYAVHYHFIAQTSQLERYEDEMQMAKLQWPQSDAAQALVYDPATLEAGEAIFETNCQSCHNEGGRGGGIGPSLVDATWVHGSDPESIQATITHGVAAKGMPAWGPILGPDKVAKVAAYIVKLPKADPEEVASAPSPAPEEAPVEDVDFASLSSDARHAYLMERGQRVYETGEGGIACVTCHQANGQGLPGAFPPLVGQRDHMGDCVHHAGIVIHGLKGEIVVNGVPYNGVMTAQGDLLDDLQIAAVTTYVRNTWGNDYGDCSPEHAAQARTVP